MTKFHSAETADRSPGDNPPATRLWSLQTTDFDELASAFPGWDMHLIQLGRGKFSGRVVLAQHGCFQLFEVKGNRSVLARGDSPAGSYEFAVIQDRNAGSVWRGRALRPGMINIRGPGEPMDHRTAEDCVSMGLAVDASFVRRVASSIHGVEAEAILRSPVVTIDRAGGLALDRSLRWILRQLAERKESETHRLQIEDYLVEWLSTVLDTALPDRFKDTTSLGSRHRVEVVCRAEEYMHAHLDRPLSLVELCEVVGVSERTLLYAFNERTGQSPKSYLKALRLNRLRKDLKAADPRTGSVHEIARRWGLDHPGALAADYRKLFGELPGWTLSRRGR